MRGCGHAAANRLVNAFDFRRVERAAGIADRVVCMLEGRFVLEGKGSELTREQITEAYFGLGRTEVGA